MKLASFLSAALFSGAALVSGLSPAREATLVHESSRSGSLSLVTNKKAFTFKYATKEHDSKNWIGIYYPWYGGPVDEEYVTGALAWAYAGKKKGEVRVNSAKLVPGSYKAFFLAKDGYSWLAEPIDVILAGTGPIRFVTDTMTTHNARQGDDFTVQVGGLIANPNGNITRFSKVKSDRSWVKVAEDGTISGRPGGSDTDTTVVVEADAGDGSTASMRVKIPVRPAGKPLVETVRVMSYNMWYGGTQVDDFHEKQLRFLLDSNVDIVGTQESWGGHAIRLAKALGWHHWQSHEVGTISRYPIVEIFPEQEAGGSVRIALDGDESQLIVWNVHLGYNPYGPYDFCFDNMTLEQVLGHEAESGRTPQIEEVVKEMRAKLSGADEVPVLLTGDFNAPSHLDWTEENAHCSVGYVPWPSSVHPIKAGLVDSFRERHPDPVKTPGTTWSPIYLDNEGKEEPMDRIDFVYHRGSRLQVLESEAVMVGEPRAEPNHRRNEWTSDHKAVLTTYKLSRPSDKRGEL